MPIPFTPRRYCRRCKTELVKDGYDQTVHLETARTQCPDQIDEMAAADAAARERDEQA